MRPNRYERCALPLSYGPLKGERPGSNRRPPGPQPDALPLSYARHGPERNLLDYTSQVLKLHFNFKLLFCGLIDGRIRLPISEPAVFIRKLLLSLLGLFGLGLGLILALFTFDLHYNSSSLAKYVIERAIGTSGLRVRIGKFAPQYLKGRLYFDELELNWKTTRLGRIRGVDCNFSLAKLWRFGNVMIDAKADSLFFENFGTCKLDPYIVKGRIGLLTGIKDIAFYCSDSKIASFWAFGRTINFNASPALAPSILRSDCIIQAKFSRIGKISSLVSSGSLSELTVKSLRSILPFGWLSSIASDAEISRFDWNCDWHSKGIFLQTPPKGLEFKLVLKRPSNELRLAGFANETNVKIALDSGQGASQVLNFTFQNRGIKGFGPISSSSSSVIHSLTSFLPGVSQAISKFTLVDGGEWRLIASMCRKEIELKARLFFKQLKLNALDYVLPSASVDLCFANSKYTLLLNSSLEQEIGLNAEFGGSIGGEHVVEGEICVFKETHFPSMHLRVKPGVCQIQGRIEKRGDGRSAFVLNTNLAELGFAFEQYGLVKPVKKAANLKLTGVSKEGCNAMQITFMSDGGVGLSGEAVVTEGRKYIKFHNLVYGRSDFSIESSSYLGGSKVFITGNALDLAEASMSEWISPRYHKACKETYLSVGSLHMKGNKGVRNVEMYSIFNGVNYTGCTFQGSLGSDGFINVTLNGVDEDNASEGWVCRSNDLGEVLKALGIYEGITRGALDLSFDVDRIGVSAQNPRPLLHGDIKVSKFRVEKLPFFFWAASPEVLIKTFAERKDSLFSSAYARFRIQGREIFIERAGAKSFSSDILLYKSKISSSGVVLRGGIAPSWYGLGNLVRVTPIVGDVLQIMRMPGVWIPFIWKKKFV